MMGYRNIIAKKRVKFNRKVLNSYRICGISKYMRGNKK